MNTFGKDSMVLDGIQKSSLNENTKLIFHSSTFEFGKKDFTIDFWVTFSPYTLAGNSFLRNRFLRRV